MDILFNKNIIEKKKAKDEKTKKKEEDNKKKGIKDKKPNKFGEESTIKISSDLER